MARLHTFIITGDVEGGKSLFLKDLSEFLILFEKSLCGFISRGQFNSEGQKDFILKDIASDTEIHLASRNEIPSYLHFGNFYFNPVALETGNHIIQTAITSGAKILIIDEIGPLELAEEIWYNSFCKALANYNGILIFSTRQRLINAVVDKFHIKEAYIENIERTSARKIGEAIQSLLNTI
ncbi:MAG: hypothetical protein K9H49_02950 [Bacteroidales bacterium]|nr:hypothetical protein [Bacteroidales bacterium]MCF8389216.1 hypothetical protein [Bacteroidales bacterium]